MPLNVIEWVKGLVQNLQHILWLSILKMMAELIIHCCQHNVMNRSSIVEPLLISISDRTADVRSWLLGCWIYQYIQDLFMLQDYF